MIARNGYGCFAGHGMVWGRTYTDRHPLDKGKGWRDLMAKLLERWQGLHKGAGGTYIRPTFPGYEYGRWSRHTFLGIGDHCRFERLGDAATVEEAKAGLEAEDRRVEARTKQLNKRRR